MNPSAVTLVGALLAATAAMVGAWLSYHASRKNTAETNRASPYSELADRTMYLENANRENALIIGELAGYLRGLVVGMNAGTVPPLPPIPDTIPDHVLWGIPRDIFPPDSSSEVNEPPKEK